MRCIIETAGYVKTEARDFDNFPYQEFFFYYKKSESAYDNKLRKQESRKFLIHYLFENKLYLDIPEQMRVA